MINSEGFKEETSTTGTKVKEEERNSDRLSELPDNIINHIMSFLSEEDIFATAVSSKTWRRVRSTHTVLNLNERSFVDHKNHGYASDDELLSKFIVFVYQNSLQRFLQSKLHLQKFSLVIDSDDKERFDIFNDWIQFALNNNVAELDLWFSNTYFYSLPKILFSSKLLTVLHLFGCELSDENFSDKFKYESLRELVMNEVHILSENVIQCLINSFPCMIKFVLNWCNGVKNLNLSNLNKLNTVEVYTGAYNKLDSIHIEALSLCSFKLFGECLKCDINLDGCTNLEVLHIERVDLPNLLCQNLSSNFPLLRTLFLCKCNNLGRIRIASQCLESLTLLRVEDIVDATIDTPNLHSFEYKGDLDKLFLFSIYTPRLCDATIIEFKSNLKTTLFFSKLRALIGKLSPNRILSLSISTKETFKQSELRKFPIPQLCHVKHLKLDLHSISSTYIGLVNGILWSCHPETLSMVTGYKANNDFIQALYDAAWDRRTKHNCCKSDGIKCWRHDLKHIEIEGFSGTNYEIALAPNQNINFKFMW